MDLNNKSKQSKMTEDFSSKHPSKYNDDMSIFMAWQNYCWMEYSKMLYKEIMVKDFQMHCLQLPNQAHVPTQHHQPSNSTSMQQPVQQQPQSNRNRIILKLAPLHKRIAAEFIDFLLLAVCKITAVFYLFGDDYFDNFNYLLVLDENTSFTELEAMLMQAILFRVVVIAYEAYMLSGTLPFSCGRTIGKKIMNLKVVYTNDIQDHDVMEQTVALVPKPLGVIRSSLRALLKNTCMSLFFPVVVPIFMMFNFNRLIYDVVVDGVVIDTSIDERVENNGVVN